MGDEKTHTQKREDTARTIDPKWLLKRRKKPVAPLKKQTTACVCCTLLRATTQSVGRTEHGGKDLDNRKVFFCLRFFQFD